jgi:hypothetical protein
MKIIEEYWRGDIVHDNCESAVQSLASTDEFKDGHEALARLVGRLMDELVVGGMPQETLCRVFGSGFRVE